MAKRGPKPKPRAQLRSERVTLLFSPPDMAKVRRNARANAYVDPKDWLEAVAVDPIAALVAK